MVKMAFHFSLMKAIPTFWNGLAFLLDAMIEDGDYPNPVVEEQPDPIGIITSLMKLMKWAVLTGK